MANKIGFFSIYFFVGEEKIQKNERHTIILNRFGLLSIIVTKYKLSIRWQTIPLKILY
jgi:hypothetical protein